MRKIILALTVASLISCEKKEEIKQTSNNIVYIDSSKLLNEYEQAKDIEAKYKAKSEQMGKELDAEVQKFRADVAFFEKNAQTKGAQWTQQTGVALQEREQRLAYAQQAMMQQLQEESGDEMDSLVKEVKDFITAYGKEQGYDYILSTDGASTILYAKDGQDITSEIVKMLNDKYKVNLSKEDDSIEIEDDTTSVK
ncbi:MAG: OmpH family outer membrane protein [Flavobacteriaceae bacterium]